MRFLFLLLLLVPNFALAGENWDLCSKTSCTEKQQLLQRLFADNPHFNPASQAKHRYTGSCWQKNSSASADPNEEFFALFHFYPGEGINMRGLYSFGGLENPFTSMSDEEAEEYLKLRAPNIHALEKQPSLALFYKKYQTSEHFTWYRTNADASELYLIDYSIYEKTWSMHWCSLKEIKTRQSVQ